MSKKISWLDQFADDYGTKFQKEAKNIIAEQIIVDRSAYPDANVGSFVDYKNTKYKVVDTKFQDSVGPGIVLEKLAEGEDIPEEMPADVAELDDGGEVEASLDEEKNCDGADCENKNCGDETQCGEGSMEKSAFADALEQAVDVILSDYPDVVDKPGGVKPIPSAPIEGPGKKNVTDAPYHPTSDPGEKYALDVPDTFQEAADRTADIINQEDAQDRTTVDGHYTWNQNIIINNIITDPEYAVEESFEEEELPAEDVQEVEEPEELELPAEEETEAPVEETKEETEEEEKELPKEASDDSCEGNDCEADEEMTEDQVIEGALKVLFDDVPTEEMPAEEAPVEKVKKANKVKRLAHRIK